MKVSFLFGSGADTDACKNLKSGQAFAEALLKNRYSKEIKAITGIDASHFQLLYSRSKKIYIQTILEYEEKAIDVFGKEFVNKVKAYVNDNDAANKEYITKECADFYKIIRDKELENEELDYTKVKKFFLTNAVFFDSLDEKFNSLRDTNLDFNSNAKRVINAYYTVFLTVFNWLYDIHSNFEWSLTGITNKLKEKYKFTVNENCYYSQLEKSKIECNVITTNYTELAGLSNKGEIAYLHGKMTWFEDLEKLTVYDCTDEEEAECLKSDGKIYVPFIMIPSGVKPIICRKQICEFEKFINYLDESDYLIIVGYKFNSEDNHINSILADWLRKSKKNKIIYLNYDDAVDFSKFKWIEENSINNIEFSEKKTNIDSEFSVVSISINKDNCRIAFEKILKELEEKIEYGDIPS